MNTLAGRGTMSLSNRTIFAAILAIQATFVGITFEDQSVLAPAMVVAMLLAFLVGQLGKSRSAGSSGHAANDRDAKELGPIEKLPRAIQWALCFVLAVVIVAAVTAWRIGGRLSESGNAVYLGVDSIAHVAFFLSLTIWIVRPERGHVAMLPLGMIVVLMSVAGGGVSQSRASQTVVGLFACIAFVIGAQVIGSANVSKQTSASRHDFRLTTARPAGRLKPLFSMMILSLFLVITGGLVSVTDQILPSIQANLRDQIRVAASTGVDNIRIGGMRYVSGSRLGSISEHLANNPAEVALRVQAEVSPGYLRGTAFDLYRGQRWHSAANLVFDQSVPMADLSDQRVLPTGPAQTSLAGYSNRPLRRFLLADQPSTDKTDTIVVRNDTTKGPVIFLPLNVRVIEASSEELTMSRHGIVRAGIDVSKPYLAIATSAGKREKLSTLRRRIMLDVPDSIRETITRVTENIVNPNATPKGKAVAIERYFQRNYEYEINKTKSPDGVDPLSHFVSTRHAAHCEYFASATVMMLRSAGVPARYVTGYIVDEVSDDDESLWYARNRDAHAWVEAFDETIDKTTGTRVGEWFAVESTPGRRYQTLDPSRDEANAAANGAASDLGSRSDDDGWLSRLIGSIFAIRITEGFFALFRLLQWPLFIGLVYIWWTKFLRPQMLGKGSIDQLSRKRLRQVDRKVAKWSLVRQPNETLYQFADRVDNNASGLPPTTTEAQRQLRRDAASYYRRYADARYQGELPAAMGF